MKKMKKKKFSALTIKKSQIILGLLKDLKYITKELHMHLSKEISLYL
jgi:hypothetical protein